MIPQLPEGPSTRNLIGAAQLARMKPGAFIVNVSRPDVIDRAALIEALKSGKLGGFALDPLYQAPTRDDDELLQLKNVILAPHLAGAAAAQCARRFRGHHRRHGAGAGALVLHAARDRAGQNRASCGDTTMPRSPAAVIAFWISARCLRRPRRTR